MGFIIAKFLITSLAFLLAAQIVPGIGVSGMYIALVLAFLWGLMNLVVRPVLLILTLPINFITFGLFTFVINGFLLWLLGTFVQGFAVESFFAAFLGAVILSLATWAGDRFLIKIS